MRYEASQKRQKESSDFHFLGSNTFEGRWKMHPAVTMKHWSRHVSEHLHSRHFWAGVAITLLIVAVVSLLFILARNAPIAYPYGFPYNPSGV
jgi:hypothetical protein